MIIYILITCCALAAPVAALAADPVPEGMTVVREPQTGKLRAPTAAELRAMRATVQQPGMAAPEPLKSTVRADGSRAIDLGERGMVYSVMTRNADGGLAARCIKGGEAAARALDHHPEDDHAQR